MDKITVKFDLTSSDYAAALGFDVLLDDKVLLSIEHVKEATPVSVEIDDVDIVEMVTLAEKWRRSQQRQSGEDL